MKEDFEKYPWFKDYSECSYDSPADFLWFYVIKGCGCGSSHKFKEDFWAMFETIKKGDAYNYIYKDEYNELIAQMLDSRNLLEHGSSIAGSWLNESGEALYKALQMKPINE